MQARGAAQAPSSRSITIRPPGDTVTRASAVWHNARLVDRRLANRNIRTALIAGVIALLVFAASFVVAFVY